MLQDIPDFGEEVARDALDAKQMRHLADNSDINKSLDEATHHRCGNEGSHPAHAHDAEKKEKNADQHCEGGGKRIVVRGGLNGDGAHSQRRNQAGGRVRVSS